MKSIEVNKRALLVGVFVALVFVFASNGWDAGTFSGPLPIQEEERVISCDPEPTDMTISFGDLVTCQLEDTGDTDRFRFFGNAGEVVGILVTRTGGLGGAAGKLLDPDNTQLGIPRGQIDVGLEKTGIYTIEVSGTQGVNYAVSLERILAPSPTATPLFSGQDLIETINPAGDVDIYFFRGAPGDLVTLSVARISGLGTPVLEVFDPDGAQIGRSLDQISVRLEKAGIYAVRVASSGPTVITYSLNLQCEGACPPVSETVSRLFLPYASAGRMGRESHQTTFVLVNTSEPAISGTLELFQPDGATPLPVTIGGMTASSFALSIPSRGVRILETEDTTPLVEGYAQVATNLPVRAQVFVRGFDNRNRLVFKTGYAAPNPVRSFTILADSRERDSDSGLVILNANEAEQRADLTLELLDREGQPVGQPVTVSVESGRLLTGSDGGVIQFMSADLFSGTPGIDQFEGTIVVTSSVSVSVLAVQKEGDRLTISPVF